MKDKNDTSTADMFSEHTADIRELIEVIRKQQKEINELKQQTGLTRCYTLGQKP